MAASGSYPAQPDQITRLTYDGAGHLVKRERQDGAEPPTLHTEETWAYDGAGRPVTHVDPVGLVTTTTYNDAVAGGAETRTLPGGATETTTHYLDGQVASVTGSAVVHRFYEYGVEGGLRYTEETTGRADALSRVRTYTDALGRTARVEEPRFGATVVADYTYGSTGQLVSVSRTGAEAVYYVYDELGELKWSGLDLDSTPGLQADSTLDRITETTQWFHETSVWFEVRETGTYPTAGSNDRLLLAKMFRKVSCGGADRGLVAMEEDRWEPTMTTTVTASPHTPPVITRAVTHPGATIPEETVLRNGRVEEQSSQTGVRLVYGYDGLGRRTHETQDTERNDVTTGTGVASTHR